MTSPFQLWFDENMQGYAVSPEILKLMAMAFEGGKGATKPTMNRELSNFFDKKINLDEHPSFYFNDPPYGAFVGSVDMIKWLIKNRSGDYYGRKAELKTSGDIWNR